MSEVLEKKRRVTMMKDTVLKMPELYLEVYISGPPEDAYGFPEMFAQAGCRKSDKPEEADLVVFTGGPDVNPAYYGEEAHGSTRFNVDRDNEDIALYKLCYEQGIPMFGVCRGAQFLWVMNGGKLYQDVDGHVGNHKVYDPYDNVFVPVVSSVHHQMVKRTPGLDARILGTTRESSTRAIAPGIKETGNMLDIEAFWLDDTACLGIQGHPEYSGYPRFRQWSLQLINDYIQVNTNLELRNNLRRFTKDFLEQRKERLLETLN